MQKDWKGVAIALLTLLTVLAQWMQSRENVELRDKAETLRGDSAEYTIPEILKLQERMTILEGQCAPPKK